MTAPAERSGTTREAVPVRTILAVIGLVLATVAALYVVLQVRQVLTWMVVAAFFAVALAPVVEWLQKRVFGHRRALATLVVFLLVLVVLAGIVAVFVVPIVAQGKDLAQQLPALLDQARQGRGPVGDLLERTHALEYVQNNQARIRSAAAGLTPPAAGILKGLA